MKARLVVVAVALVGLALILVLEIGYFRDPLQLVLIAMSMIYGIYLLFRVGKEKQSPQ